MWQAEADNVSSLSVPPATVVCQIQLEYGVCAHVEWPSFKFNNFIPMAFSMVVLNWSIWQKSYLTVVVQVQLVVFPSGGFLADIFMDSL